MKNKATLIIEREITSKGVCNIQIKKSDHLSTMEVIYLLQKITNSILSGDTSLKTNEKVQSYIG